MYKYSFERIKVETFEDVVVFETNKLKLKTLF